MILKVHKTKKHAEKFGFLRSEPVLVCIFNILKSLLKTGFFLLFYYITSAVFKSCCTGDGSNQKFITINCILWMGDNLPESLIVLNNYKTFKRTPNNSWSRGNDSFQQHISRHHLFLAHRDIHLKALP